MKGTHAHGAAERRQGDRFIFGLFQLLEHLPDNTGMERYLLGMASLAGAKSLLFRFVRRVKKDDVLRVRTFSRATRSTVDAGCAHAKNKLAIYARVSVRYSLPTIHDFIVQALRCAPLSVSCGQIKKFN